MADKSRASQTTKARESLKSKRSSAKCTTDGFAEKTRQTKDHIFFSGGPLSNWYRGDTYSGARALALMIQRLDEVKIDHPSETALSSRLLENHMFNCGEQWMMAIKGWLFERNIKLLELPGKVEDIESFSAEMLAQRAPPQDQPAKREVYRSTLCSVLRATSPKEQKRLGRECRHFDAAVWDTASIPAVVACSIARAEVDPTLKRVYLKAGKRTFVEGSFRDRIWGVGIHWTSTSIEDPQNWRGTNRLGTCHGLARDTIVESIDREPAPE